MPRAAGWALTLDGHNAEYWREHRRTSPDERAVKTGKTGDGPNVSQKAGIRLEKELLTPTCLTGSLLTWVSARKKGTNMSSIEELLDYFNGRLSEEKNSGKPELFVDKQKLIDLLAEVEFMRKPFPSRQR
jgi:hypothetical protein